MSFLKPLTDLIHKLDTRNIVNGYVSEILTDANGNVTGYEVKAGAASHTVYDSSNPDIQVRDLVALEVMGGQFFKLTSISSGFAHRVDIITVNLGAEED